jgi:hypothetical protein
MKGIHGTSLAAAKESSKPGNEMAGFIIVAKAMQALGVI